MPAPLLKSQFLVSVLLQRRLHVVQDFDGGTHLSLIHGARCLSIRDRALKIHLRLALFLGDNGLNDERGLLWSEMGLL
jgi:hypothetical protein